MSKLLSEEFALEIAVLSDFPEFLNPLWIMPQDVRAKAKFCGALLTEDLLEIDPYIARLWFVCADKQSGKQKMAWLVNHYKRLSNLHLLRPAMLNELWVQVELGFIPANGIGEIFEQIDGKKTIGHIAYDLGLYEPDDTENVIKKAIEDNPQAVADYQGGSKKALGTILGVARAAGITDMRKASQLAIKLLDS